MSWNKKKNSITWLLMGLMLICNYGYSQNFIYNGGFEYGDVLGAHQSTFAPNNSSTSDFTADYLDYWQRAKGLKGSKPSKSKILHSPDWYYCGDPSNFCLFNAPTNDFTPSSGYGMLDMAQNELIQQEFDLSSLMSELNGILNPKIALSFKIRIYENTVMSSNTKLEVIFSKNELDYKTNNANKICKKKASKFNNSSFGYEVIYSKENLKTIYAPGEWHQVTHVISVPSNMDDYNWIAFNIIKSYDDNVEEFNSCKSEFVYLDDIKLTLDCEDDCSRVDGAHNIVMTSNTIHNNSAVVINNTDNLTDLQFEVYSIGAQFSYYNEAHCVNGLNEPIYWDGKSLGGADLANGYYKYKITATNDCYTSEHEGTILKADNYLGPNLSNFSQECQSGGNLTPEECCLADLYIDNETLVPPPFSKYIVYNNIWACTQNPDFSDEVKVVNGANVLFQSGKQITLAEGFNTENGAVFCAQIKPDYCGTGDTGGGDTGGGEMVDNGDLNIESSNTINTSAKDELFERDEAIGHITLYPNPTNDILNLKLNFASGTYQLYDVNGKLIKQNIITSKETSIDLSKLNSGIYFFRIQSVDGKIRFKKVIKN